jgi:hypothetical protein
MLIYFTVITTIAASVSLLLGGLALWEHDAGYLFGLVPTFLLWLFLGVFPYVAFLK